MKKLLSMITMIIFILAVTSNTFANGLGIESRTSMKTYFVAFNSSVDLNIIKTNGGEVKKHYKYMPLVAVKLSYQAAQALAKNPKIDFVEEDGEVQALGQTIPWGVPHVKATDVHINGITGAGIKVGIIDTGIDYTHEDLQVKGGTSFVPGTIDYLDDNGHGTHVAGTVAALNNTVGVLGVAPQANLYAIKVLDQYGVGTYSDVISGIEWAITNNMNIINLSLGGSTPSQTLQKAVEKAYYSGILVIAAAGNNGFDKKGNINYPAKYSSVIAVGAIDKQNSRANFSSVGRELELMAPGVDILSTVPKEYVSYSGTSMAAAHVTGVAALLWEARPELTNVQIRNILNETAMSLGNPFLFGNGLVDAHKAINYQIRAKAINS